MYEDKDDKGLEIFKKVGNALEEEFNRNFDWDQRQITAMHLKTIRQVHRTGQLNVEILTAICLDNAGILYIQKTLSGIIDWAESGDTKEHTEILKLSQEALVHHLKSK